MSDADKEYSDYLERRLHQAVDILLLFLVTGGSRKSCYLKARDFVTQHKGDVDSGRVKRKAYPSAV